MASVSMAEAVRLRDRVASLQKSTRRAREKVGEVTQDLVRAAEVSAIAAGIGYFQGARKKAGAKPFDIFGVPLDLGVGVAAHVLGIMGVGGAEEHLKAIGDGALATYFSTLGFEHGAGVAGTSPIGMHGAAGAIGSRAMSGQSMTAQDLAKLATLAQ